MQFVVYAIKNKANSRAYIGCASMSRVAPLRGGKFQGLPIRFAEHLSYLHNGEHCNKALQADWSTNADDFVFEILQHIEADDRSEARQVELKRIQACPESYNLHTRGRFKRGPSISEADRRAIAQQLHKGRKGKLIAREFGVSQTSVSRIKGNLHKYPSINKETT